MMGIALPEGEIWRAFAMLGLLNNVVPFSLIFWGQTHIPSGLAAILNATTPLFTMLMAHVATTDEKLDAARLFGVAAGMIGVVVMIGPNMLHAISANVWASSPACLPPSPMGSPGCTAGVFAVSRRCASQRGN